MRQQNARERYEQERAQSSAPRRRNTSESTPATQKPHNLAEQRSLFGFDDIPVDVDDIPLRKLIGAWLKRGVPREDIAHHAKRFRRFTKQNGASELKDDLKWAIAADLDEDDVKKLKAQPHSKKPAADTPAQTVTKNVDININFGSLPKIPRISRASLIKTARRVRPSRKVTVTLALVTIVGVGAFATYYFWPSSYVTLPDGQRVRTDSAQIKDRLPQYSTLTPDGKDIRELGGWARVSPADSNPVFAYADSIDGTNITVSQQPLPENLKGNTNEKITELAKAYSASDAQKVDSQTFFVGTASEGPQSVILAKDDLLILIKSSQKISDDKWKQYVKSLE